MRKRWELILGIGIILVGLLFLVGYLFDIDTGALCFPTALILLGVWLLLQQWVIGPDRLVRQMPLGDVRRRGPWQVTDEEFWSGVGDVRLDLTEADIPPGETHLRAINFVGDVRLWVPQDVGVSLSCSIFVGDIYINNRKRTVFSNTVRWASDNFETAERKVHLDVTSFAGNTRIVHT